MLLSYTDEENDAHYTSSNTQPVNIPLFPHIKEIHGTSENGTHHALSAVVRENIQQWMLAYHNTPKHVSTLPLKEVCLYEKLKETWGDEIPHTIIITLDMSLIQLLGICVPVKTSDGKYVLNSRTKQRVALYR